MPKIVYVAHPIAGDVEENVKEVLRICKQVHTPEIIPIAPYLVAVQYLQDHIEEERGLGIAANRIHFQRKVMDETWVYGNKISEGMKGEILLSLEYNIPVKCCNPELKENLDKIIEEFNSAP